MSSDTLSEQEIVEQLEQFGLSEKEIDTYLAILDNGEAKASTIADETGVSKRYVYSLSEDLEERGFVDVNDHVVPTTIEARPPEETISRMTSQLETLGPALAERFTRSDTSAQEFEVIKSRVTVLKRIREYLAEAEQELALTIPQSQLGEIEEELRAAADRDVLGLLIVNTVDADGPVDTEKLEGIASVVRVSEQAMPVLLTVDNELGLFAPLEMVLRSNTDNRSIAFTQEQLVPVLVTSFLGNYWALAEEVYVSNPPALPRTFGSFRNAVHAATVYLRDDVAIEATAEVRPAQGSEYVTADDADYETVSGRVVETTQGLVEPTSSGFAAEHSFVVERDGERISVGGFGAFTEDYEAREVTLAYADES
ncbi:TrmB family transcriptional regulator sugar-binding domain-containing protein [Halomicrobium salinisoli]|uniref:TrmB family transcriptional regulator sugar-binding domain-containing protein n=1 Tax=Halomicrobium salinisoli TaxID=2878391 RepID=UPI001CF07023|nr:TrmB family transcriptional regulator sugar-binding domain-containing protein [Halomicrobium salinisoli]